MRLLNVIHSRSICTAVSKYDLEYVDLTTNLFGFSQDQKLDCWWVFWQATDASFHHLSAKGKLTLHLENCAQMDGRALLGEMARPLPNLCASKVLKYCLTNLRECVPGIR